ncbi:MAG: GNAT family N-acetyltransferase [Aestuariibaculum sp.]
MNNKLEQNPFLSNTFKTVWAKHFCKQLPVNFDFIKDLDFYKVKGWPLYINIGKNLTKGVSYILNQDTATNNKNTYLIYDIPEYFNVNPKNERLLKINKVKQYQGFLINLKQYDNFTDYSNKMFSKSRNKKLQYYNNRLEMCFNISQKMLMGYVDQQEYDYIFNCFHKLLIRRFNDKETINNNLESKEWVFYQEVVCQLILENKAGLHIIYNNNTPISITLLYFSDTIVFDAIPTFDIDYAKFNLGKISIKKVLEWCFENNYETFDFSKGYFTYKEEWSDLKYYFEYHVLYNPKSLISTTTANAITRYFKLKQFLRDKKLNEKLHKVNFIFNNKSKKIKPNKMLNTVKVDDFCITKNSMTEINLFEDQNTFLRKYIFDFLFLEKEHVDNIKVYNYKSGDSSRYLVKTDKKSIVLG